MGDKLKPKHCMQLKCKYRIRKNDRWLSECNKDCIRSFYYREAYYNGNIMSDDSFKKYTDCYKEHNK